MQVSRVLLVEDNPIVCRLVRAALEADHIRVLGARDGRHALELWTAEPVDLVLQGVQLPDMQGFELARRLRALPGGAEVPILAISGRLSDVDEAQVSALGFNDVIVKPTEAAEIREVVRAHLAEKRASAVPFGRGRSVLIVDDDPIQAKLAAFRFTRLGFEVRSASDGVDALRTARERPPDAIVSDIMMPGLDGFGLCNALRHDPELVGVPMVLMTNSYLDEADRELARAAGADAFVIRTPTMHEVIDALRSSLKSRAGGREPARAEPLEVEQTWPHRVRSQLERQVAINAGMARRCSLLSAEVAVLSGMADALSKEQDIDAALTVVLGACVDAGGFALGMLQLTQNFSACCLRFGEWDGWSAADVACLVEWAGESAEIARGQPLILSVDGPRPAVSQLLGRRNLDSIIAVPVRRAQCFFGTLLMGSNPGALQAQDRLAFLDGVATQIAQALTLTLAFADKDASERRAQEQATVLRSVVETVAEGVIVTDGAGNILHWNQSADAILRAGGARIPARDWPASLGLCHGDTLAVVAPEEIPLVRALSGEVVDHSGAFVLKGPASDADRFVTIGARPLKENERIVGAVAVLRDVTDEKATQGRLLVADRLASIGMLAAGVAHEINNPLAAVAGNLELATELLATSAPAARETEVAADLAGMLHDASVAADRVRRIVADLRVLARGEEDISTAVDIHAVLESVLRMANNEVRHRARVVREYGQVPHVRGNESRLCQVFLNLVINAAQALPDGRADENEIRVGTRMDGGHVVVSVQDTGEGIPPEAMRQLFLPFFTTKRVGLGTGLGLSICQRLVTAAGGEISVESRRCHGATFRVALPAAGPPEGEERPESRVAPVSTPNRRGRVLLVDDDEVVLSVLSRVLGSEHDCTTASAAREAVARIQAGECFDLILCDLMMPVMNGMDLYHAIDRVAPRQAARIVFLSGGAFTPELQEFLSTVDNDRLEKPFEVASLRAKVDSKISENRLAEASPGSPPPAALPLSSSAAPRVRA